MLTLLPGATAWTQLASLPRELFGARASILGGRFRVNGGFGLGSRRFEVMIENNNHDDGYEIDKKVDLDNVDQ